jgi:glutathione reductase (NADPH)
MSERNYDVVVIGAGAAGNIVATTCKEAGRDVAVVERDGWGGVCPLRGCEPKKTLADVAHAANRVRDLQGKGLKGDVHIDWPDLMRVKRSFTDDISDRVHTYLDKKNIDTLPGEARFDASGILHVSGHGPVRGRQYVIAVGARPRQLDIPGSELLLTSDAFLELDTMPDSLLFIGGGFIALEFACIAAAAGARVTVLHRSEQLLKGFDPDCVGELLLAMEKRGVEIITEHLPVSVEQEADTLTVVARQAKNGTEKRFAAKLAVLGAGRVPNTDTLGLEHIGVKTNTHGVVVDEYMRSVSNQAVFAAGDCAEYGMALTPVAALQAEVVAHNIIHGVSRRCDLSATGTTVFTDPPLSRVGLLEKEAQRLGVDCVVHSGNAAKWSEHKRLGIDHAWYKILEERDTGRILGAHYLGQHAEEIANILGLAVRHKLTRADLLAHPWAYPSFGYALRYMLS